MSQEDQFYFFSSFTKPRNSKMEIVKNHFPTGFWKKKKNHKITEDHHLSGRSPFVENKPQYFEASPQWVAVGVPGWICREGVLVPKQRLVRGHTAVSTCRGLSSITLRYAFIYRTHSDRRTIPRCLNIDSPTSSSQHGQRGTPFHLSFLSPRRKMQPPGRSISVAFFNCPGTERRL